ncbi:MAG: sel1 repeat family protein [Campylobacteraceae bacterium]|jgi:TPR repeat protein|nr:sel1 repeat family protein [Campylobacteraceae bacterium]
MKKFLISLFSWVCVFLVGGLNAAEFDSSKVKSYEKKCTAKSADGCFYLGVAYFLGEGFEKNDAKALDFFKKADEFKPNNPLYISTIARMYYYDYKTEGGTTLDEAIKLFDRACKLKDAESCFELGEIYNFDSSKFDNSKAASYYKLSCNLKDMDGCLKLRSLKDR